MLGQVESLRFMPSHPDSPSLKNSAGSELLSFHRRRAPGTAGSADRPRTGDCACIDTRLQRLARFSKYEDLIEGHSSVPFLNLHHPLWLWLLKFRLSSSTMPSPHFSPTPISQLIGQAGSLNDSTSHVSGSLLTSFETQPHGLMSFYASGETWLISWVQAPTAAKMRWLLQRRF